MTLLLIAIVAWISVAVLVCLLGRAAKMGDEQEVELASSMERLAGPEHSKRRAAATADELDRRVGREVLDARLALRSPEARLARLEGGRAPGAA